VLAVLGRFNEDIAGLSAAIRRGDGAALFDHFTRTRAIRQGIVASASIRPRRPQEALNGSGTPS
jgi:hypothetical protein